MKVDLVPEDHAWKPGSRAGIVTRALPFCRNLRGRPGTYVHRPRSAHIYRDGRIAITYWCGNMCVTGRFLAAPDPSDVVCGTCEGRAVGAGQIPGDTIAGHALRFSPQINRDVRCEWKRGRRGYGWTDYHVCGVRARVLATRPSDGAVVHLCGCCSKLAGPINAGFTDHQPLATVWRGPAARAES